MKHMTLVAGAFVFAAFAAHSDARCRFGAGDICARGEALAESELIARMRVADIVILGERHDNPAHHVWQARMVAALAPGGLAFEMIPREAGAAANAARRSGGDLRKALSWDASGWPAWEMYAPIFAAAPKAEIAGGGVARGMLRVAIAESAAKAFPEGAERYGLATPFSKAVTEDMLDEQDQAHCGALPAAMLPGMAEAQRLRDAAFADAALRLIENGRRPVVLITGNGHARTDRGAPFYLRRAAPGLKVFSVGQIEQGEAPAPPPSQPFDAVFGTAPFDRGDPCEDFVKSRRKPAGD